MSWSDEQLGSELLRTPVESSDQQVGHSPLTRSESSNASDSLRPPQSNRDPDPMWLG